MSENQPSMQLLQQSSALAGANSAYLEAVYESYLKDPNSVEPIWQQYFADLAQTEGGNGSDFIHSEIRQQFYDMARMRQPTTLASANYDIEHERKQGKVNQLIDNYRLLGHLCADVNPIKDKPELIQELKLAHLDLADANLDETFDAGNFSKEPLPLKTLVALLNDTYCGSVGMEYLHISSHEERDWLQQRLEHLHGQPQFNNDKRVHILERVCEAEGLEKYIGSKFPGAKRFSLEGGEALIPLMDEIIQRSGTMKVKEIVVGMAHRGRLNVLVNNVGKLPEELFKEFSGQHGHLDVGSGDVKYHQGFSSDVLTPGGTVHLALAFNPSHLAIVTPVITGSVRARQDRRLDRDHNEVLPIAIHGDAAFAGQGVIMETLNMAQTRGYRVGGTVHIIVNNHIGFTTSNTADARSTLYSTDVAKMIQAPIFHVNGDDPEAVVMVAQLAIDYRMKFNKDVVIDLSCYRRHGHNEADEPAVTQPMMYKKIRQHPTLVKLYGKRLQEEGVIEAGKTKEIERAYRDALDEGKTVAKNMVFDATTEFAVDWSPYLKQGWRAEYTPQFDKNTFLALAKNLAQVPADFQPHSRIKKIFDDRQKMAAGEQPLDWGFAENMAYATLLHQGHPLRISGQDCCRGTFFHRHAVVHDATNGDTYIPLRHVAQNQPEFTVIDSVLSEEAVLAFEFGYSTAEPRSLVIWEAQFGDFANGAQVVIDQFISSAEQKWGRLCNLVMLLPHGYEGQGPEHTSARLERFLQLCAQHNMQVCYPTTPAQIYHLLRRQMLRPMRRPLIVMTPKSLLRHKLAVSSIDELADGQFELVIPDPEQPDPKKIERIILCSGKVYYDLLQSRQTNGWDNAVLVRIEQLYPFAEPELTELLAGYGNVKTVVWCQEEPLNQGAWYSTQHHLRSCLAPGQELQCVSRAASASPAVGYVSLHQQEQEQLIKQAFDKGN